MNKLATIVTLAVIGTFLFASTAMAVEETFSGRIEILQSLSIEEAVALDFGAVNKPSSGTNLYTLDGASVVAVSGAGDGFAVPGTAAAGQYTVYGQDGQEVVTTVAIVDFTDPAINIQEARINNDVDSHVANLDGSGELGLSVTGAVEVGSAAALGVHTTDVVLTANYQ